MRLVIQRVSRASVAIEGRTVSGIGNGLLVLVGVETGDTEEDMRWLVGKTVGLRISVRLLLPLLMHRCGWMKTERWSNSL